MEPWIQASTELELRNANVLGELAALETKHQYVADHLQECQQVCTIFSGYDEFLRGCWC